MRILLDYRPALRERTGVGEYVHQLATALARRAPDMGDELTLFSSSWKDRLPPDRVAGAARVDCRIPVSWLNLAWHRLEFPPVEWLAGRPFDVVHSPHPLLLPSRRAARVVTVHDLDFLLHPERTRAEIRRDYPRLAEPHARRADRVVVPSQYTAGRVRELLGVPDDRISVCPHGAPDWTPRDGEATDGEYFLFLGTLEPRKNLEGLVEAYERLRARVPDAPPLVVGGKAPPEHAAWADATLGASGVSPHIRRLGYVSPESRRELYEGARALVYPSLDEGFGLPALEAMTLGVPVVASNRGALPEVVGDAGLLVEPDAEPLADALAVILTDAPRVRTMVAAGLLRARRFTWSAAAEAAREAYAQALTARLGGVRP